MNNFLKNKGWEDYLIYFISSAIILGLLLFLIGFFWQMKVPKTGINGILHNDTYSVSQMLSGKHNSIYFPTTTMPDHLNLFTFMENLKPSMFGYSMAALAISGFSFIMLGITTIVIVFIASLIIEFIVPRIKSKKDVSLK